MTSPVNPRARRLRFAALGASGAVLATGIAFPAAAFAAGDTEDDVPGEVSVVNTETVQVYTDANGNVDTKRLYEQLSLTGEGTAEISNPALVEGRTTELRNLEGFGGFEVQGGEQVFSTEVDGTENFRTVTDFRGDLPLDIDVVYTLDGKPVEAEDLVGASGDLEVTYTVTNVTGRTQTVTFDDGKGGKATEDVTVAVPMVGSLTTILPESFREVSSEQANLAGDGRGNTKVSFTMTLVPPVGSDTATFGYQAELKDGTLPEATVNALPVNPFENPTFSSAGDSYASGAETGADLADGASQIDANLLKLRDGAGELLGGLIQLRDGAAELRDGLQDRAAPGAGRLADGAAQLKDGLGDLDDGAGRLSDGAGRLSDGTGDALQGSQDLTAGLGRISGGLDQLAAADGLPAAQDGIRQLSAGVDALLVGLGSPSDPNSLIGGLAKLQGGLAQLETGSGQLVGGIQQVAGGLPAAKGGVDQVRAGLQAAANDGSAVQALITNLNQLKGFCAGAPQCVGAIDQIIAGVQQAAQQQQASLNGAADALGQVSAGLASAIAGLTNQILPGAQQLNAGLTAAKAGAGDLQAGAVKVKGGVAQVGGGLDKLSIGIGKAVSGVLLLADGADTAHDGSGQLSDGLGRIDDGAGDLADGSGLLADGTGRASLGSGQLMAGAEELAEGLGDAANGSGRLADGLVEAAEGAPKLVDGAQELSDRGTSKLVDAGAETAQKYGALYATLEAGAERAEAESMVIGAPEDAIGLAAYTYEIQGEDGEAGRNLVRGLAALGLLAASGAVLVLRRRLA